VIVGLLKIDLALYEAQSLKDKRRVIKSIKERLSGRFNVSVAEIGALESRKRAVLGVAVVGTETAFLNSCLDTIVDFVRGQTRASLIDYQRDFYHDASA
jgi:uncharacterized protein YlxP (DUF503 family)